MTSEGEMMEMKGRDANRPDKYCQEKVRNLSPGYSACQLAGLLASPQQLNCRHDIC